MFKPKLWEALRSGYTRQTFLKDLTAGVIVGIVAIPLAVAFAIASGVSPDKGLLTAVIGGFLVSLLGGSSVQIGGPTGAFIVIVYGIISKFGPDGLIMATIMAGILLFILGFAKLGSIIQFIPFPVIVGFTSGIAVIIFSSQINDFFGLGLTKVPADFIDKWIVYFQHWDKINFWALGIALSTISLIIFMNKVNKKIPSALVTLVGGTLAVYFFQLPVETIGSRFGAISGALPLPSLPLFSMEKIKDLLLPAFSIALLGGIESLLSAVVADGMIGKKHNSNMELVAQGVANVASGLFGGLPVTGAIARTATNVKSGAATPVAGIIHAIFLLGVLLFLSPLAGMIPLASLAGILATVAYNMSEHHTFRMLLRGPRGDILSLVVTFLLTVLIDLTIAIPVGILLALLSFIQKMSLSSQVKSYTQEFQDVSPEMDPFNLTLTVLPQGVEVFEIDGPLFFGAAERLKEELTLEKNSQIQILRMRSVPSIDSSGIMVIRELLEKRRGKATHLLLAAVQPQVLETMKKIGLVKELGEENFLPNVTMAIDKAKKILGVKEASFIELLKQGSTMTLEKVPDPFEVIRRVTPLLNLAPPEKNHYLQSTLERENLASTGLGKGLAFPHPRTPNMRDEDQESITVCYLDPPVNYDSADGVPVHTAIFILSRSLHNHLRTLGHLTALCRHREFQELLHAQTPMKDLIAWIEKHERTPGHR